MKTTKSIRAFVAISLLSGMLFSCQKEDLLTPKIEEVQYLSESDMEGMMKLGKQLQNPYSVETMRVAWANLTAGGRVAGEDVEITASHLYLKFMPQTEEELDILKTDSTLVMYDYPLDYEIVEGGDFYHDPSLPIDQPTYQYLAVSVDKVLPDGVAYEILAELFIPDEDLDDETSRIAGSLSDATIMALVNEALRITDNLEDEGARILSNRWTPKGTITVWDDDLGDQRPLRGAIVRARNWFTTRKAKTNADGFFKASKRLGGTAKYSIRWERYDFKIRDKWLSGARLTKAGQIKGDWNKDIVGGKQEYYATIFRAAEHYYYRDINGLRRPPQNGFLKTQMKIRANLEEDAERCSDDAALGCHKASRRFLGLGSQIQMYTYDRTTQRTYATVMHELAHASHWRMDKSNYNDSDLPVVESWANGVEWHLTRMTYPGYTDTFGRRAYTGIVIDLIDGVGIKSSSGYYEGDLDFVRSFKSYNDQVSGYTLRQIEDALKGQSSWNGWKNSIKNKYNNDTEEFIDAAFDYWNSK